MLESWQGLTLQSGTLGAPELEQRSAEAASTLDGGNSSVDVAFSAKQMAGRRKRRALNKSILFKGSLEWPT